MMNRQSLKEAEREIRSELARLADEYQTTTDREPVYPGKVVDRVILLRKTAEGLKKLEASTNRMIMVNKLLRLANAITELDVAVLADDRDKHAGKTSWSDSNVNYDLAEMNIRTQLVLLATELK